jgi:hypothetical protein
MREGGALGQQEGWLEGGRDPGKVLSWLLTGGRDMRERGSEIWHWNAIG